MSFEYNWHKYQWLSRKSLNIEQHYKRADALSLAFVSTPRAEAIDGNLLTIGVSQIAPTVRCQVQPEAFFRFGHADHDHRIKPQSPR